MKPRLAIFLLIALSIACDRNKPDLLSGIDPGRYDTTWWNRAPVRLIQTNLPETEALMDIDKYIQSLVDASVNTLLLNVGGIVANYPTGLAYHYKNKNLRGDLVGELVERLHKNGIRIIGRFDFSKINETLAAERPEWLYVGTDGRNVNYNGQVHTCINGGYQQEYAFRILEEAIGTYPLDGIFFNMSGYQTSDYSGVYHGFCQCENCRKRFYDSTGMVLPKRQDDPSFRAYREFQRSTSTDLFNRIRDHIKTLDPGIFIFNYQDAGVDWIASESSSSLSTGYEWNYNGTGNVKPVLGSYNDRIPGNLLIYFQAIGFRHIGTSPNLARVWMLENMLHGAPVTFVVIGTLVDYQDRVFIPVLCDLYGFHRENEKLFTNIQAVNKVALLRGSRQEYQGLIKLLTEEHIMYDVLEPASLGSGRNPRNLSDYEVLILGDPRNMDGDLKEIIDNYVAEGGKLLTTGTSTGLQSLGIMEDYGFFPRTRSTYLTVSEDDKEILGREEFRDFSLMMMYSDFLKCTPRENASGYLRLVPETMFGPPEKCYFTEDEITDFPGVIVYDFGEGKSVFIPWGIGAQYNFKGNYAHKALFVSSIRNLLDVEASIETDAPSLIEITHQANLDGAFEWFGMINHSGQVGASIQGPLPVYNTTIRFKPAQPVKEINLMRSGERLRFSQKDGCIECIVPRIDDFELILCTYN